MTEVIWIVWSTTQGPLSAFESKADADEYAMNFNDKWIRVNCVGLARKEAKTTDLYRIVPGSP